MDFNDKECSKFALSRFERRLCPVKAFKAAWRNFSAICFALAMAACGLLIVVSTAMHGTFQKSQALMQEDMNDPRRPEVRQLLGAIEPVQLRDYVLSHEELLQSSIETGWRGAELTKNIAWSVFALLCLSKLPAFVRGMRPREREA